LARWDDSERWYEVARDIAATLDDPAEEALVLDGVASSYLGRGRIPKARAVLAEASSLALLSGDAEALASVNFSLMTVAHTEGRLAEAAQHGWDAFLGFGTDRGKLRSLTALGGVFMAAGSLDSAEDAFAIVLRDSRDRHYRLYALAGLARVQAARGDLRAFESANLRLDEEGCEQSAPEFRAEMFLERGDGYLELGLEDEARRWYRLAMRFSDRHGVNEYLMRAESALAGLDLLGTTDPRRADEPQELLDSPDVDAICRDLGVLRRQPAAVDGWQGPG
jgi:tetratricopeptide (TPR) repeat protein